MALRLESNGGSRSNPWVFYMMDSDESGAGGVMGKKDLVKWGKSLDKNASVDKKGCLVGGGKTLAAMLISAPPGILPTVDLKGAHMVNEVMFGESITEISDMDLEPLCRAFKDKRCKVKAIEFLGYEIPAKEAKCLMSAIEQLDLERFTIHLRAGRDGNNPKKAQKAHALGWIAYKIAHKDSALLELGLTGDGDFSQVFALLAGDEHVGGENPGHHAKLHFTLLTLPTGAIAAASKYLVDSAHSDVTWLNVTLDNVADARILAKVLRNKGNKISTLMLNVPDLPVNEYAAMGKELKSIFADPNVKVAALTVNGVDVTEEMLASRGASQGGRASGRVSDDRANSHYGVPYHGKNFHGNAYGASKAGVYSGDVYGGSRVYSSNAYTGSYGKTGYKKSYTNEEDGVGYTVDSADGRRIDDNGFFGETPVGEEFDEPGPRRSIGAGGRSSSKAGMAGMSHSRKDSDDGSESDDGSNKSQSGDESDEESVQEYLGNESDEEQGSDSDEEQGGESDEEQDNESDEGGYFFTKPKQKPAQKLSAQKPYAQKPAQKPSAQKYKPQERRGAVTGNYGFSN